MKTQITSSIIEDIVLHASAVYTNAYSDNNNYLLKIFSYYGLTLPLCPTSDSRGILEKLFRYAEDHPTAPFGCITDTGVHKVNKVYYQLLKYYTDNPRFIEFCTRKNTGLADKPISNRVNVAELLITLTKQMSALLYEANKVFIDNHKQANRGVCFYNKNKLYHDLTLLVTPTSTRMGSIEEVFKKTVVGNGDLEYSKFFNKNNEDWGDIRGVAQDLQNNIISNVLVLLDLMLNFFLNHICLKSRKKIKSRINIPYKDTIQFLRNSKSRGVPISDYVLIIIKFILDSRLIVNSTSNLFADLKAYINYISQYFNSGNDSSVVINKYAVEEIYSDIAVYENIFKLIEDIGNTFYSAFFKDSKLETYFKEATENISDIDQLAYSIIPLLFCNIANTRKEIIIKLAQAKYSLANLVCKERDEVRCRSNSLTLNRDTISVLRLSSGYYDMYGIDNEANVWLFNNYNINNIATTKEIYEKYALSSLTGAYYNSPTLKNGSIFDCTPYNVESKNIIADTLEEVSPYNYILQVPRWFLIYPPGSRDFASLIQKHVSYEYKMLYTLMFYFMTEDYCVGDNYGNCCTTHLFGVRAIDAKPNK